MSSSIFKTVNSRLWLKVLIPVSVVIISVVMASLWYNISFQTHMGETQIDRQNKMLACAIEGGMFDALAIGDNDTVRKQFRRLGDQLNNLKVYVYDFHGVISFSTDSNSVGKEVKTVTGETGAAEITEMIKSCAESNKTSQVSIEGQSFLLRNLPITNEKRCFHCHGSSRKVLGGISVLSSETEMTAAIGRGQKISMAIGFAGLFIIIMMVWVIFHFLVNKKVVQVLDATSRMRQKDFTYTYEVRESDEMSHILARINLVTEDLRKIFKEVVDNSDTILDSVNALDTIAHGLNTESVNSSEKAGAVSAAASQMSSNNRRVAQTMEKTTGAVNSIVSAVEEMSSTVAEISRNVNASKQTSERVAEDFKMISRVVAELEDRANDVDMVTDKIRAISDSVSLLALNAKVEAARAGEYGKGFAVVAEEITELAGETSRSTLEADEKLRWIKEHSKEVAKSVADLTGIVNSSDEAMTTISAAVEEQSVTMQDMAKNISHVSGDISKINESISESAQAVSEIADEMTAVEKSSARLKESSISLSENSSGLTKMAEGFRQLMSQFKV